MGMQMNDRSLLSGVDAVVVETETPSHVILMESGTEGDSRHWRDTNSRGSLLAASTRRDWRDGKREAGGGLSEKRRRTAAVMVVFWWDYRRCNWFHCILLLDLVVLLVCLSRHRHSSDSGPVHGLESIGSVCGKCFAEISGGIER